MSPLNKQQLDHIRNERKQQIKQAALGLFARRGFAGTKTSMIASEAGISEGLIYRYYKSKDELYSELVQDLMEEANQELAHLHLLPGTPYDQLRALTQAMLDEKNKHAFMVIIKARQDDNIPEMARKALKDQSENELIERLVPIFQSGQQAGQFTSDDPRTLLYWYFFILNSLIMQDKADESYGMLDADVLMRILKK